jgi:predicted enzyme related to lactoylglutathione lyase
MSHAINWFEIAVNDLDRAMGFYARVTGRKLQRMDFGVPGQTEAVFETTDPSERTGSLVQGGGSQPSSQGAVLYLNVEDDLDACLTRVTAAGGAVVVGKTALPPGMGSFAQIRDTEGNRIGLHSLA